MTLAEQVRPVQVGDSIGKQLPKGWYMRKAAAKKVGRSSDTLKTWHQKGVYEPSGWWKAGKLKVRVYSDEDIEAMRVIAATRRPGRPPKDV